MTRAQSRALASTAAARSAPTGKRRQRNVRPTQWAHGEFVAVDGEGFSDGAPFERIVGSDQSRYSGREHFYAYLAASDGSELYNPGGRLRLSQCLSYLCGIVERNPFAILVAFGASYDVTHMVGFDLSRDQLGKLLGKQPGKLFLNADGWTYSLEYRPRKCLTIQRWPEHARRWSLDKNGNRKATPHLTVRLWDVWGFFQDSFVGVMSKWCPEDPDYQFVRRMKGERTIFDRSEIDEIKRYNAAELRVLVKVMNRVRDAINDLGLKITRWDGAGAVAAAMMTKHKVKEHKHEPPPEIFDAIRCAYSGGHIEACKIGYHSRTVHHYDLNSAYPDQFRFLPSLAAGVWQTGNSHDPPHGYTLVKLDYHFPDGLPFYPLFYRCEDGSILYPHRGCGWYWYPEFDVARRYYVELERQAANAEHSIDRSAWKFEVKCFYHFRTMAERDRPFAWVEDYYTRRQDYIRTANAGGFTSGPEKIIKLGLNSLYGKTAQQVGARLTFKRNRDGLLEDDGTDLRLPPFFQLDWAGYVTSGCRAKMMAAALQKPASVIMFATDGLFTTEPLDLDTPDEKTLGAWEYTTHDGITVVMPGVYWLHDGKSVRHYSRGFDKREMQDADFVHSAWAQKSDTTDVTITRLIGLGSAYTSKDYWAMRGCFAESRRTLCLDGDNSKRYPVNLAQVKPHLGLVDTIPRDHFLPNILGIPESAPYPIAWLDGDDWHKDQLQSGDGDMADDLEAMDAALA